MNETNENAKSRLTKTLAVIGFAIIIVFTVWLAVQIVRLAPSAFSSLASLAESVQTGQRMQSDLVIESEKNVANSKESFLITWSDLNRDGNYTFAYDCVEGVSLEARVAGQIIALDCASPFVLPSDTFALDVSFASEKERFVDITYRVTFIKEGESEPTFSADDMVTVANASIPSGGLAVATDDDVEEVEEPVVEEPVAVDDTTDDTLDTTEPIYYRTVYTYTRPVSDPNGFTDLAVKLVSVGGVDRSGRLIPNSDLEEGEPGAIQIEVKNIGTKTSDSWRFVVELPDGDTYESQTQLPLKPQEYSLLTIGFYDAGDGGTETIAAEVFGGNDQTPVNNGFLTTVRVED